MIITYSRSGKPVVKIDLLTPVSYYDTFSLLKQVYVQSDSTRRTWLPPRPALMWSPGPPTPGRVIKREMATLSDGSELFSLPRRGGSLNLHSDETGPACCKGPVSDTTINKYSLILHNYTLKP